MRFLSILLALLLAIMPAGAATLPSYGGTQASPVLCVDTNGNPAGCGGGTGGGGATADVRQTNISLSSALNSFIDIPLNNSAVVGLRFSGLTASGATISYFSSNDATQTPTDVINSYNASTAALSPTRTTDGPARVPVAGRTTLRLQVTTAGTGTITVSYNVSAIAGVVDIASPLPPFASPPAVRPIGGSNSATTSIAAATSSTSILAANTSRLRYSIFNESTAVMYVLENGGTASSTNYSFQIAAGQYYVTTDWQGAVKAVWASAAGNARVTEYTP